METESLVARGRTLQRRAHRAALSVAAAILLAQVPVRSESKWVDDELVLPAGWARAGIGFAAVRMTADIVEGQTYSTIGTGLNLEGALGCGYHLETGVRVGLRPDAPGRGLRADEMARRFDRETFGTGLGTVANPEGRLRWGAMKHDLWETGLEYRVVVPTASDEDITNVLSPWLSIHGQHFWRIDTTLDGIVLSRRFASEWVPQTAIGASAHAGVNVASFLFVELLGTVHAFASTPYTNGYTRSTIGWSVGARLSPCDSLLLMRSIDPTQSGTSRLGAGIMLECRFALL